MLFPNRFHTGCRNKTIPNPASCHYARRDPEAVVYEGPVSAYDFKKQEQNRQKLEAVLRRNGTHLSVIASARYKGDRGENTRFAAASADGKLMWYKYVGFSAQGGQNHVFVCGMRIKLSTFLKMSEEDQSLLLTGCLLYTSPSPRDRSLSRMPSSA